MTYKEKIQSSIDVLDAIHSLEDGNKIEVTYGKDRDGKPNVYSIKAYSDFRDKMSYSIWGTFSGMNIDKIGPTTMSAYTYDMMSNRTNYMFPLYKMSIVEPIK